MRHNTSLNHRRNLVCPILGMLYIAHPQRIKSLTKVIARNIIAIATNFQEGVFDMKLEHSLGFILNHAGRRMTQLLSHRFQPYDMTTEQWVVLNRLACEDGITQKLLAIRAEKDQTNITRILDQLERKGMVERRANEQDRRSFLTFITDQGRAMNGILTPIEQEVITSLLGDFTEAEASLLKELLVRITQEANARIKEVEESP
ncbi:MarR family transcriptional regulator [Paenibacillus sp. LMG 31457]|uniref:MarR family transcriptional regulator n=2 Tax=Paenibacillus planticolens TaxID=2654976 RepID=A0ABX1ZPT1_9BACL|nr:MarR family transcriptional regulator [Paenibacillus planticolens]